MTEEKKPRTRRTRSQKNATGSAQKQLSIKDMFGGGGSQSEPVAAPPEPPATVTAVEIADVMNISDSEGSVRPEDAPIEDAPSEPEPIQPVELPPLRPLHPFFTRQTKVNAQQPTPSTSSALSELSAPPTPSASSETTEPEPEVISIPDDSPKLPIRPLHPFFAPRTIPSTRNTLHPLTTGSSRDAPIIIESSPIQPKVGRPPKAGRKPVPRLELREQLFKRPLAHPPPFPDRDTQHVLGPSTQYPIPEPVFQKRTVITKEHTTIDDPLDSGASIAWLKTPNDPLLRPEDAILTLSSSRVDCSNLSTLVNTIPWSHRQHPAISRLLVAADDRVHSDPDSADTQEQEQWVEKWRPRAADQVVGNEEHAEYIMHWMAELRLHYVERPVPAEDEDADEGKQGVNGAKRRKAGRKSNGNGKPKGRGKNSSGKKRKGPNIVRHVGKRRKLTDDLYDDFLARSSDYSDDECTDFSEMYHDDETEDDALTVTTTAPSSDVDDVAFSQERWERMSTASSAVADESQLSTPPGTPPLPLPTLPTTLPPPTLPTSLATSLQSLPTFLPSNTRKLPTFGPSICSTLLLTGPPGSGKTAAVYAAARALGGWDVFEISAGAGERNGAELRRLVGEIGRSHAVVVRGSPGKSRREREKRRFFERVAKEAKEKGVAKGRRTLRRVDSDELFEGLVATEGGRVEWHAEPQPESVDVDVDTDIDIEVLSAPPPPPTVSDAEEDEQEQEEEEPAVNQVVILVEEVDILYQTDATFWSGLINIIKDCRRPVILTCNDISLVPRSDLALQDTLYFSPCPAPLATSYLQALCLAQGFGVAHEDVQRVYEECGCDLRRAIMQLQVLLTRPKPSSDSEDGIVASDVLVSVPLNAELASNPAATVSASVPEAEAKAEVTVAMSGLEAAHPQPTLTTSEDAVPISSSDDQDKEKHKNEAKQLARMARAWDAVSFSDSGPPREAQAYTRLQAVFADENDAGPSPDDPLGYQVLHAQTDTDGIPVSMFYTHDEAVREETLRLARRGLGLDVPTDAVQMWYHERAGWIIRDRLARHGPTVSVGDDALSMDYLPWVAYIIKADDAVEAVSLSAPGSLPGSQGTTRRATRNSMRTGQGRWLQLDLEDRRALVDAAAFRW